MEDELDLCGGLNRYGPHIFIFECLAHREWRYKEIWLCWSRCDIVGGSVSLWRWALRSPMSKLCLVWDPVLFCLSVDQEVE